MTHLEKVLTDSVLHAAEKVTRYSGERDSVTFRFWLKSLANRQERLKTYRNAKEN